MRVTFLILLAIGVKWTLRPGLGIAENDNEREVKKEVLDLVDHFKTKRNFKLWTNNGFAFFVEEPSPCACLSGEKKAVCISDLDVRLKKSKELEKSYNNARCPPNMGCLRGGPLNVFIECAKKPSSQNLKIKD